MADRYGDVVSLNIHRYRYPVTLMRPACRRSFHYTRCLRGQFLIVHGYIVSSQTTSQQSSVNRHSSVHLVYCELETVERRRPVYDLVFVL